MRPNSTLTAMLLLLTLLVAVPESGRLSFLRR
jgi:hypothetical protein